MKRPWASAPGLSAGRLLCRALLLVAVVLATLPAAPLRAEGSREAALGGGYRAYLEYRQSGSTAGVPRRNQLYVYVNPGETVALGSSAMNLGASGNILLRSPAGASFNCRTLRTAQGGAADYGRIDNRTEEAAGPRPAAGGYNPCLITADMTNTAGAGVWSVQMVSPTPADLEDPPVALASAAWTQANNRSWIAAWDITVRSAGGAPIPGRAFANYLPLNVGANASAGTPVGVSSSYYMLTKDGYGYQVDLNGIDPFGFIFFANAEGVTDNTAAGVPIYRSLQLTGANPGALPTDYRVHNPTAPDNDAVRNITHKIFFQQPAADLPAVAPTPDGTTWLLQASPEPPAIPTNFRFVGVEGTVGQAGTPPLFGSFEFTSSVAAGFRIVIDVNKDGVFGNANDRTLAGASAVGLNTVVWDGFDGLGQPLPPGEGEYSAEITAYAGEIHFPFLDPENNPNGLITRRVRDPGTTVPAPSEYLVFYDDTYRYTGAATYDYSLCDAAQTPAPPAGANVAAPSCYGNGPAPRSALNGVLSNTGAHGWSSTFGDRRILDSWAYYPAPPVRLPNPISLRQADLQITKTHSPEPVIPGAPLTYTIDVRNAGPSAAPGSRVQDTVPAVITGVTWTCQPLQGSPTCGTAGGAGSTIDLLVDLPAGSAVRLTVVGTLSSTASGTVTNTASVTRPPDVTDPNPANNVATDSFTIPNVVDLRITKSATATSIAAGQLVVYTLAYQNTGNATATGVQITETVPANTTFDAAAAPGWSCANGAPAGTVCTRAVPDLASGASATATFAVRLVNPLSPAVTFIVNTVSIADDGSKGPDPTPENNRDTIDTPRLTAPDMTIAKTDGGVTTAPGGVVSYGLAYQNLGATAATDVVITEAVPANTTFVAAGSTAGWSCADGAPAGTVCTLAIGPVAGNASGTATFVVRVRTPLPAGVEQIQNTATIAASNEPDFARGNNTSSDNTPVLAAPDLRVIKTVGSTTATPGGTLVYTLSYANVGNQDATGVVVTERVPTNTTFRTAGSSAGWSCADGAVAGTLCTYAVGPVAAGAPDGALTFAVTVNSPLQAGLDAVVNDVTIGDDGSNGTDLDPTNNRDDTTTQAIGAPDMAIVKTAPAGPVAGGDLIPYTLDYRNIGLQDATGVRLTETVPVNTVFRISGSTSGWSCADGAAAGTTCQLLVGGVAAGAGGQATFVVEVVNPLPAGAGPITNSARVDDDGANGPDPTPSNNSDDASVALPPTAVTLTRFAAAREGDAVVVRWATGVELGTAGFRLWRSADGSRAGAVRVTPSLIAARGGSGGGAEYSWRDAGAPTGQAAFYWLEEVETGGRIWEYGPARYTPAGTAAGGHRVYLPIVR